MWVFLHMAVRRRPLRGGGVDEEPVSEAVSEMSLSA